MTHRKKLIEVALPLDAINKESAREKSIRHGHPSTLHLWWARRPLAACRAVLFAQLVDDPSSHPDKFPTEEAQKKERERLFKIIEDLVKWENINNEQVLKAAREEILKSTGGNPPPVLDPFCGGGSIPLEAQRLGLKAYASDLNPVAVLITKALIEIPPKFAGKRPVNPMSRGQGTGDRQQGTGDREQGIENRGQMGESEYAGYQISPGSFGVAEGDGYDSTGLCDLQDAAQGRDIRSYKPDDPSCGISGGEYCGGPRPRINQGVHAFPGDSQGIFNGDRDIPGSCPTVGIYKGRSGSKSSTEDYRSEQNANGFEKQAPTDPITYSLFPKSYKGAKGLAEDVRYYGQWMRDEAEKRIGHLYPKVRLPKEQGGGEATVIAWLWARTVKCPNPACGAQMPLVRSFWLSKKKGKQAWVEPVVKGNEYHFEVRTGEGKPCDGTVNRRGATCLCCGTPVPFDHIRAEGKAGRMGQRLMAIVAEGPKGRAYVEPDEEHQKITSSITPNWKPEGELQGKAAVNVPLYGLKAFADLFTPRQLVALTTFSDLVMETRERVLKDAIKAGMPDDPRGLNEGGTGATAYADAVATYLGFLVDQLANHQSTICSWNSVNAQMRTLFARQAIPMTWDFAESNPFCNSSGSYLNLFERLVKSFTGIATGQISSAVQSDAAKCLQGFRHSIISTDPPYYDNIGYADLADFFYVWLRRSIGKIYVDLFSTMLVPKAEELVATPYRFNGDKKKAREFFEKGLRQSFEKMREAANPHYPLAVYYAFKQAEIDVNVKDGNGKIGLTSTGWEAMLQGLLVSNFQITGTWPLRTEKIGRSVGIGTNALASSIVLACRPRPGDAPMTTRRDFINALKRELPKALMTLQEGNIAPVDLAQSAIGPGMAIFSRYSKVLEADGSPMTVRSALALINQVLDEYLTEQEGEYDADTRWALAWFEEYGMGEGPYGMAETLSKAKNTAVDALERAGILVSKAGKVRLLRREELPDDWNPVKDKRLTVWEVTQYLIRALVAKGSEEAAADLLKKVGALGDVARELAYRLYTICDRKKWAQEALAYNSLVVAWPELVKLAGRGEAKSPTQTGMFENE